MPRYLDPKADVVFKRIFGEHPHLLKSFLNAVLPLVDEELLAVPEISEAIELSEQAAYSEGELQAYEDYWNAVSTEKTLWTGKYNEGLSEGFMKGVAEGEAKGRVEGEAKGKAEGNLEMLLQFIRLKFGSVPKSLEQQMSQMNAKTLLAMSQKIFNAKSIDDISK